MTDLKEKLFVDYIASLGLCLNGAKDQATGYLRVWEFPRENPREIPIIIISIIM